MIMHNSRWQYFTICFVDKYQPIPYCSLVKDTKNVEHQAFRFSSVSLLCHQFVQIRKLFLLIDFDIDLSVRGHLSGRENWGFDHRNTNKNPLCGCYNWKCIKVFRNYIYECVKRTKAKLLPFFLLLLASFLHFRYKVLEQAVIIVYFSKIKSTKTSKCFILPFILCCYSVTILKQYELVYIDSSF